MENMIGIWVSRTNGGHDEYMHMYKCAQAFVAYTVKGYGGQYTMKGCGGQDTHWHTQ